MPNQSLRSTLALLPLLSFTATAGCHRGYSGPVVESVRFAARAEVITPGDSLLRVRVIARNTGRAVTWSLELGHCSLNFRVAMLSQATPHEWDYARWRTAVNPLCPAYLESWRLAPGDSLSTRDLERIVKVRDVLGDSLPPGRYRVIAFVGFNSSQTSGDLAAGEVELRGR